MKKMPVADVKKKALVVGDLAPVLVLVVGVQVVTLAVSVDLVVVPLVTGDD
jgi:hypothetical protein